MAREGLESDAVSRRALLCRSSLDYYTVEVGKYLTHVA